MTTVSVKTNKNRIFLKSTKNQNRENVALQYTSKTKDRHSDNKQKANNNMLMIPNCSAKNRKIKTMYQSTKENKIGIRISNNKTKILKFDKEAFNGKSIILKQ